MTVLIHIAAAEGIAEHGDFLRSYRMFRHHHGLPKGQAADILLYLHYGETREGLGVKRVERKRGTFFQFAWS